MATSAMAFEAILACAIRGKGTAISPEKRRAASQLRSALSNTRLKRNK